MTKPIARLQTLIKESVPPEKQADFNTLLKEYRHSVVQEIAVEACRLTGDKESRWHATELIQFTTHFRAHLLKHWYYKEELCQEDSPRSAPEI